MLHQRLTTGETEAITTEDELVALMDDIASLRIAARSLWRFLHREAPPAWHWWRQKPIAFVLTRRRYATDWVISVDDIDLGSLFQFDATIAPTTDELCDKLLAAIRLPKPPQVDWQSPLLPTSVRVVAWPGRQRILLGFCSGGAPLDRAVEIDSTCVTIHQRNYQCQLRGQSYTQVEAVAKELTNWLATHPVIRLAEREAALRSRISELMQLFGLSATTDPVADAETLVSHLLLQPGGQAQAALAVDFATLLNA